MLYLRQRKCKRGNGDGCFSRDSDGSNVETQEPNITGDTHLLLIAAIVALYSLTDRGEPTEPEEASTTPEHLLSARATIQRTMKKTKVAAISVAVVKDDEIVWEEGFGWADRKEKIKATPHTIYRVASLSKAMTATGLMVLVERGLVDLDLPANQYLGESKLRARAGRADDATVGRLVFPMGPTFVGNRESITVLEPTFIGNRVGISGIGTNFRW